MRATYLLGFAAFSALSALAACASTKDTLSDTSPTGPGCTSDCGGLDAGASDGAAAEPFVAIASDFQDFEKWPSFYLGNEAEGDVVHLPGPRTVYINKLPPAGASEFPVGTIIVKVVSNGDRANWQVFGSVKRGDAFNPFGAIGWEWFGLNLVGDTGVKVEWRGADSPSDAGYGGPGVNGVCNRCHGTAAVNDYVLAQPLALHPVAQ